MTPADWFAVLPGTSPAAQPVALALRRAGAKALAADSGRPWIMGRISAWTLTTAQAGSVRAAVIGDHCVTGDELTHALHMARTHERWEEVARWPGSYHLAVHAISGTWLYGDAAGLRVAFAATAAKGVILASHARPLANAVGTAQVDSRHLAMHLLGPVAPSALAEGGTSPYTGVSLVPPGQAARVDQDGRLHTRTWWTVPDDTLPLPKGTGPFRAALGQAVSARCQDGVAVELSGGLDSSSLSALAYRACRSNTLNLTRASQDPANDDLTWARLVAQVQPGARHRVLEAALTPRQFDGWQNATLLDAPSPTATSPDRGAYLWRAVVSGGHRVLLSGKGGDEVLLAPLTYLHRTPRSTARRHTAGWAALRGESRRAVRAQAAQPRAYRQALTGCLDQAMGWEAGPWVPPWLSTAARRDLAEQARRAADAEPLHEHPHQHRAMAAIRAMARLNRLQEEAAGRFAVRMAYPFLDRQVLEAALSVRGHDRTSPYRAKPLLQQAMRNLLPLPVLARRTKGGYNLDDRAGTRAHRQELIQLLLRESALADFGLIDPWILASTRWEAADPVNEVLLHLTLTAEIWVRTAQKRPLTPKEQLCTPWHVTPC